MSVHASEPVQYVLWPDCQFGRSWAELVFLGIQGCKFLAELRHLVFQYGRWYGPGALLLHYRPLVVIVVVWVLSLSIYLQSVNCRSLIQNWFFLAEMLALDALCSIELSQVVDFLGFPVRWLRTVEVVGAHGQREARIQRLVVVDVALGLRAAENLAQVLGAQLASFLGVQEIKSDLVVLARYSLPRRRSSVITVLHLFFHFSVLLELYLIQRIENVRVTKCDALQSLIVPHVLSCRLLGYF